ncbi:LON peptidase substrate-binding domain-containing protein [Bowmanella pacifica]|uniref:ATP-dependent protease n=1 Tax=Bowmanella pacifica TaxID=502051 RepID=A0A918DFP2_9ALTE|nr:LON peptidase substrate-binding domain-containing protein [Bowmanella pacifica]GGO63325.1 ATP-dependent protease [Bowmanella pacifica]
MASEQKPVALFPLSAHLLPGGRLSLRIFEPRYLRMVKEACAAQRDFAVCMLNAKGDKQLNQHIYPLCTLAKVIDFSTLQDGLLGIVVEGQASLIVDQIETEQDGLRIANCEFDQVWNSADCLEQAELQLATDKLRAIFTRFADLPQLYPSPDFGNAMWVLFRWLELLPVDASVKQALLSEKDCRKVLLFLTELLH